MDAAGASFITTCFAFKQVERMALKALARVYLNTTAYCGFPQGRVT